jgi:glycosyltransferase involved in cell wall biosynthesis
VHVTFLSADLRTERAGDCWADTETPSMTDFVPVAVVIPTYNRGLTILTTLERIFACDPLPAEIWVHIDAADGKLEHTLASRYPEIRVLTSPVRMGPGAGRHRCLQACKSPFAASFDDDSFPVDPDFFGKVERLFLENSRAAIVGATIWHHGQAARIRENTIVRTPSYTGCGYAIRVEAYRRLRGHLPRPVNYGMEESDLAIQLFAAGWRIVISGELRVFHDTDLSHHNSPEVTAGVVANVALCAFLNYPISGFPRGLLQVANTVVFSLRRRRIRGLLQGITSIPMHCYRNRQYRDPISRKAMKEYLRFRRTGVMQDLI